MARKDQQSTEERTSGDKLSRSTGRASRSSQHIGGTVAQQSGGTGGMLGSYDSMRRVLIIVASVASAVAVVALLFSLWQYTQATALMAEYEDEYTEVVVPVSDISAGTAVSASNFTVVSVPANLVPSDASANIEDYVGGVTLINLTAGVPVSLSAVTQTSASASFADSLESGTVAMSISISGASALSPLIQVGDHVAVIATSNGVTSVVFEDLEVLALDSNYGTSSTSSSSYSMVTLKVTEEEAITLSQLSNVTLLLIPTEDVMASSSLSDETSTSTTLESEEG